MIFVKIENRKTWLRKKEVHYPNTSEWLTYWKEEKKKCIEGLWAKDFDGWRYMSGNLYFYINYCTMKQAKKTKEGRKKIRPSLRDVEWERSYLLLVSTGFSGFQDDTEYNCHTLLRDYYEDLIKKDELPEECIHEGKIKKYKEPLEYLRGLHSKPLGLALYNNNSRYTFELGSRGGGKSYWYALAVLKHELIFDGAKYYTDESIKNPASIEVVIGAALTSKSTETVEKLILSWNELATNNDLGVWGSPGDLDYEPSPFFKFMVGDYGPNNANKKPWRHEYKEKTAAGEVTKGTGSKLIHVTYTIDNAQAAVGTRPTRSLIDEVGLVSNLIEVWNANEASLIVDSVRFGTGHFTGTAGNIEKITESKILFTTPDDWDIVSYEDTYEHKGRIGFFLPAYYVNDDFKDDNGNTNIKKAKDYYLKRRQKYLDKKNERGYVGELMNFPILPSEMWIGRRGNIFPIVEAEARLEEVNKIKLGTSVELYHGPNGKVEYKLITKDPVHDFPLRPSSKIEGCVVIYEFPDKNAPKDLYLVGYDPHVSENLQNGGSLSSAVVIKNPKYVGQGYTGNIIVATYIGKPELGRRVYLENLELLLEFYGNGPRMLWFEADKGDYVRAYFEKKNKTHLLCLRPTKEVSTSIKQRVNEYGWLTGNRYSKLQLVDSLNDWLREKNGNLINVQLIPDAGILKEIIAFDIDSTLNFDRIMSLIGAVLAIRETFNEYREKMRSSTTPTTKFLQTIVQERTSYKFKNETNRSSALDEGFRSREVQR